MSDPAFEILLSVLSQKPEAGQHILWFTDENTLNRMAAVSANKQLIVISNRFDVAEAARKHGHNVRFGDFDLSGIATNTIDRIVYRISKEKAVVHHIINEAARVLKTGGELHLGGQKNEGVKTYIDKTIKLFGNGSSKKHGIAYSGCFSKQNTIDETMLLDDQNYHELRFFEPLFFSKPGLFGWNKIDHGSALLLDCLPSVYETMAKPPQTFLDLGCGYGFLTIMTRDYSFSKRVATDNNAAAVIAAQKNITHWNINATVTADNCAMHIEEKFDLILCNPPFHLGFDSDGALTEKFLRNTQRLLAPKGVALFVVNHFIALEKKAVNYFTAVKIIASNRSFKVIAMAPD